MNVCSLLCRCATDNCRQNKQCCKNLSRRSQRWTSVCRWRTRSSSGNFTMETWAALAERPLPQAPPLMPSASNHLAAPPSSPALLCLPDNTSLLLPVSSLFFGAVPLELWAKFASLLVPSGLAELWLFAYRDGRKKSCTDALVKHGRSLPLMSAGVDREKENLRTSMEWMKVCLFYMLTEMHLPVHRPTCVLHVIKILLLYTDAGACTAFL